MLLEHRRQALDQRPQSATIAQILTPISAMNIAALFLLILLNVALIVVASRRQLKSSRPSTPSSYSRFNLIVAMLAS